jgi:hypothetical protein
MKGDSVTPELQQPLEAADGALTSVDGAEVGWQATRDDRFLVLPHPEPARDSAARTGADRWLGGTNRVQHGVERGAA